MAAKYDRLTEYLQKLPGNMQEVTLSFKELEAILGSKLPKSASDYRQWWANMGDTRNRPQARAWTEAGFAVDTVHQTNPKWVRFKRSP